MIDERKSLNDNRELARWYNEKYFSMGGVWDTPVEDHKRHLDFIGIDERANRNLGKLLLDVGCGDGTFVYRASERIPSEGIDISQTALRYGWDQYGDDVNLYRMAIEDLSGGERYDYITSLGSIEHVVDISKALERIWWLLKRDGLFYAFVPNEKWIHVDQANDRRGETVAWAQLFMTHGFAVTKSEEWNDSSMILCRKTIVP